jgi:hypothetical protein
VNGLAELSDVEKEAILDVNPTRVLGL